MKITLLALLCGLLAIHLVGVATPREVNGQARIPSETMVNALSFINKEEFLYRIKNRRFAAGGELLAFLREKGSLSRSPIDLDNPKPYELLVTTSPDGMHYQVTLQRLPDLNTSTWCRIAAFSDDRLAIFLGFDINSCPPPQPQFLPVR